MCEAARLSGFQFLAFILTAIRGSLKGDYTGHVEFRVQGFPKIRGHFLGAYNKDQSTLGSTLGSPYSGRLPHKEIPDHHSLTSV